MPQRTSDSAVRRPDLGQCVDEYRESLGMGNIGLLVMPVFPAAEQSSSFPVIPKEVMLKLPDTRRAMRSAYNRSPWEFEDGFYSTKENGWEEVIDDRERKLYRSMFDAEAAATRRAVKIVDGNQESRIASKVFNTTNFSAHAVTNEWDDATNATPIDNINTGKKAIRLASGMLPNALVISYSTFLDLKNCDQIVDRLMYTFPGIDINQMTTAQLAMVFDLQKVLVGGMVKDTAKKGQSASISDVWNKEYAMLTRVAEDPTDIGEPCIGRTFIWDQEGAEEAIVESYRDEGIRGDVVRVRNDSDERLTKSYDEDGAEKSDIADAVSYLFSNITT